MRVEALISTLQQEVHAHRFLVETDKSTQLGHVRVGDVLQGKVVQSLGSNQYLVRFEQAQVTVQSQLPMNVGGEIKGRVQTIGKQIVLERLSLQNTQHNTQALSQHWSALVGTTGYAGLVTQLRQENQTIGNKNTRAVALAKKTNAAKNLLERLGFTQAYNMQMKLSHLLCGHSEQMDFAHLDKPKIHLNFHSDAFEESKTGLLENQLFIEQLALWLQNLGDGQKFGKLGEPSTLTVSDAILKILNVQTLDKWHHVFHMGQVVLDKEKGTLSLAVFSDASAQNGEQKNKPFEAVTLTCDHPQAGLISFSFVLAAQRLQLAIGVPDEDLANALRQSMPVLTQALHQLGFKLDDYVVGVIPEHEGNWAAQSVVDVMLRADALDRKM